MTVICLHRWIVEVARYWSNAWHHPPTSSWRHGSDQSAWPIPSNQRLRFTFVVLKLRENFVSGIYSVLNITIVGVW